MILSPNINRAQIEYPPVPSYFSTYARLSKKLSNFITSQDILDFFITYHIYRPSASVTLHPGKLRNFRSCDYKTRLLPNTTPFTHALSIPFYYFDIWPHLNLKFLFFVFLLPQLATRNSTSCPCSSIIWPTHQFTETSSNVNSANCRLCVQLPPNT